MNSVNNINRLLIANRGEIAARIIRTCQHLGIESVLASSQADLDSLPARLADQVINIGPPPSLQSYLNVEAVIKAAVQVKADAIHPGYGFLSEMPHWPKPVRKPASFLSVLLSSNYMLSETSSKPGKMRWLLIFRWYQVEPWLMQEKPKNWLQKLVIRY